MDVPAGSYTVLVNGSNADFRLDTANTTSIPRTADMPIVKSDIQVDDVNVEIGRGSPSPFAPSFWQNMIELTSKFVLAK